MLIVKTNFIKLPSMNEHDLPDLFFHLFFHNSERKSVWYDLYCWTRRLTLVYFHYHNSALHDVHMYYVRGTYYKALYTTILIHRRGKGTVDYMNMSCFQNFHQSVTQHCPLKMVYRLCQIHISHFDVDFSQYTGMAIDLRYLQRWFHAAD